MTDVKTLRSRLEALRTAAAQAGNLDPSVAGEAESLQDDAFSTMGSIIRAARARGDELRASEQREYDSLDAIRAEAEQTRREHTAAGPAPVFDARDVGGESPERREAFDAYLRTGNDAEMRALNVGTDSAGGYTAPEGFRSKVTETLKAFGGVRRLAEVITTADGTDLPWPTNDDTANSGTGVQAESTVVAEQDLTFGQKQLGAFMYPSGIVRVSLQLLQDSGIDLESFLGRKLGERIARKQSPHFVTGTGSGQPQGIVTGGVVGKTGATGQVTSVIYDDLVDLVHSVDPAYRENADECGWLMNDATFAKVRKLKDSTGRPLVEPDVKRGVPNSILGFRVVIDQAMPDMAASAKSIAFGNVRAGYIIREVRGIAVVRLVERYMDVLQHGFIGYQRADGLVQDSAAYKLYQHPAS